MALTKVSSSLVSDNAVTSGKIADGGIATADIAANAVTSAKIAQNSILTKHIDDGQVTTDQLGADAVTSAKIADDAISEEHLDVTVITSLSEVTAATGDLLMIADISDSNNLKKIPVSSILAGTHTGGSSGTHTGAVNTSGTISSGAITSSGNVQLNSRLTFGYNNHYFEAGTNSVSFKSNSGTNYLTINNSGISTGTISSGAITAATSLTVNSDANSSLTIKDAGTDAIQLVAGSGDELYIGPNNAYKLRFKTDGNIVMDNGGNVGIGTSSPTVGKLQVNDGSGAITALTRTSGSTSGDLGTIRFGNTDVDSNLVNIVAFQDGATNSGALKFETQASGGATTERMSIDSSGNVVIGNSSYGASLGQLRVINDAASAPASLSLFGYSNISDDVEFAKIDFASQISGTGGNPTAKIAANIEGTNERAAHLTFHTHNDGGSLQERMRIDSSGNLGLGETSPDASLHITSNTPTIAFDESDASQDYRIGSYGGTFALYDQTNSSYRLAVSNAGNVGINCIAPEEKLVVDGGLKIANANNRLYFGTEGGTSIRALEGNSTGNVIQVGEGYTNVLLGSASAKVGIRQTSPDAMLHIDGASNSIAGLIIEGSGNGDVIHQQFKAKANNGTLSYHGISASPGADQDDNTISFGNGAGNGVHVNHQNVVRTRYSEIHSGGTFSYDVGGTYLGANGSGFGTHAIFRTPSVTSPSSGAASTQFLTVYSSGHWGEYALARFRLYTTYFQGGYREYLFRMVASTCNLEEVTAYGSNNSIGAAPGTITKGSVTDTGTDHSGQNIYKVDLTFSSSSAYYRNYVVAEINYGSNKYYSSGTSSSTIDGYDNGGKYHFKTISLAEGRGKFTS